MASLNIGKKESVDWVMRNFERGSTCLDVGVCDGKWSYYLGDYLKMDGIEIYEPNIRRYQLETKYNKVILGDIKDFKYDFYDLIIFGDVLEHLTVRDAQTVLEYATPRCKNYLVAVPFMWHNRSNYGNPWEVHLQEDLTPENTLERYPMLKPLFVYERYGYYTKGEIK